MGITMQKMNQKNSNRLTPWLCIAKSQPGDNIDGYSRSLMELAQGDINTTREAEAIFRFNNQIPYKSYNPYGIVLLNPHPLSEADLLVWQREQVQVRFAFDTYPLLADFMATTTNEEQQFGRNLAQAADTAGWNLGLKTTDILGYTSTAVGGSISAAAAQLKIIEGSGHQLMTEAVAKHGKDIFNKSNLKTLDAFLKENHKFQTFRNQIEKLNSLLSEGVDKRLPKVSRFTDARWFRRNIFLPSNNPGRYCQTLGGVLSRRIQVLSRVGRATTWWVPAGLGLYNVYQAPQEQKLKVATQETVGIISAAVASGAATFAIGTTLAFFGVATGGLGFIVIAVVAGVAAGATYEGAKIATGKLYDTVDANIK